MDLDEFPTSPAKRQRTSSPEEAREHPAPENREPATTLENDASADTTALEEEKKDKTDRSMTVQPENGFLDVLMQHVEAESSRATHPNDQVIEEQVNQNTGPIREEESDSVPVRHLEVQENGYLEVPQEHSSSGDGTTHGPNTTTSEIPQVNADTLEAFPSGDIVHPESNAEGPEWEVDSSPYESSSDSDSDTTTSEDSDDDDDEDADGDYAMLDPEEQARILMQGEGGSDDEGGRPREKGDNAPLRTANERHEEIIPKPDITITEDMQIQELGNVEAIVEGTVLVRAKISGEYQVLESGSILCLKDRTVLGVVAETLGRVEQPLYTIRFTNDAAIEEAGLSERGTTVYYVHDHSTFVFTQPLKNIKGSDASNFHDEEVGDDEMEFSDDEAEAEHKRQLKLKRQGRRAEVDRGKGGRSGRGGTRGNRHANFPSIPETGEINYDDVGDAGNDEYTPLVRPSNLHEMMVHTTPQQEGSLTHPLPPLPSFRGRGQSRGRDRGSRGPRGGNRGGRGNNFQQYGFNQYGNGSVAANQQQYQNGNQQPYQGIPPPFSMTNHQFTTDTIPPTAPTITPQAAPFTMPFSPSPISPLPRQQFNFSNFSSDSSSSASKQGTFTSPMPSQQQYQQQFNPGFMGMYGQNQQQHLQQPQQQNFFTSNWTGNQAAAAQVQRQLEELQKGQRGNN